jgi:hypothetical protein
MPISFETVDFGAGVLSGLVDSGGVLTLAAGPLESFEYEDPFAPVGILGRAVDGSGTYLCGSWTSPVVPTSFEPDQIVTSWNSKTAAGTWIQSEVRARVAGGRWTRWYVLGRWVYDDSDFHRASVGGQDDRDGRVAFDVLSLQEPADGYQLRLTIFRRAELAPAEAPVTVSRYSAVVSSGTDRNTGTQAFQARRR